MTSVTPCSPRSLTTGATPLLRAAQTFDNEVVRLLLAHGALVDLPNASGVTPFMAAAGIGTRGGGIHRRFCGHGALGVAAVLVIWRTVLTSPPAAGPRRGEPVEDVRADKLSTPVADAQIKGDAKASVVLVEFSDFECPFCEKYSQEVFELIDRDFVATRRLRYAFRHFPLENAHPNAVAAAEAAECASRQGRFWEMRRLLFAKRGDLAKRFWRTDAVSIGLDAAAFADCLDGSAVARVRADLAEGRRLGLNSTPSFVIGVAQPDGSVLIATKIQGAQPYEVFKKAIERSL